MNMQGDRTVRWAGAGRVAAVWVGLWSLAVAGGCKGAPDLISEAQAAAPGQENRAVQVKVRAGLSSVRIDGIPHVRQKPDFCGEACVEMAMRKLGHAVTQDQVFAATRVNPTLGRGAVTRELARGLRALGFDPGKVWYRAHRRRVTRDLNRQFARLHADLLRGVPSIVCTRFDTRPKTTKHFRLITGYDARTDEVLYHDPALANGAYKRMKRAMLYKLWPLKYHRDRWTVIRMPLSPRAITLPGPSRTGRHTPADFAQHIRELKRKVPRGFHLVVEPPFVVIGNESKARVGQRARWTVRWAVQRLKKAYFAHDPNHIIDVWLFKDRHTYRKYTYKLFGEMPGTPYGFYSSHHRALVMNISTGGGTLVHEIVHPFVEANFPGCPAWFNEGLGSLYEQSANCRKDDICGLTNWRLPGLQNAIRAGRVPSFRWLMSRTENQFYGEDPGTNYGQSRYLVYYLQQKKVLRTYYKRFLQNRVTDPTGHKTLSALLAEDDMALFQKRWQAWVMTLRYR